MRRFITVLLLTSVLAAWSPSSLLAQKRQGRIAAATAMVAPKTSSDAREAAKNITAQQLHDYLDFIASDEMEGRDTPSRGLNTAALFIKTNLARWGLKPAGDNNTYYQRIALRRSKLDPEQTRAEINGQTFKFGDDFVAQPTFTGTATGALVYVGNGWFVKAKNLNPYQNIDVKDRIIVAAGTGLPKNLSYSEFTGKRGEGWGGPVEYAQRHGARGVILVPDAQGLANFERTRQTVSQRGATKVERFEEKKEPAVPVIVLSQKAATALFDGEKQNAETVINAAADAGQSPAPFEFSSNKKVGFTVATAPETVYTQNVVAMLEGSDPVLKNEYVAMGAHYDHVGMGTPVNGDAIYNGADDDGSGTVAVLAIAEAMSHASTRPKRSILFVWHCGEEKGLWGSEYFTKFPTVPINQIVAQINIDMIGRSKPAGDTTPANKELSGPNEIYVIGSRMMSTELGQLTETANKNYLNLNYNYLYDDPKDPNRFFFRSDHFNYAQRGIPIVFFFDGVHVDYHRPSDSPDKVDYQKMERVARTIYVTAMELANAASRPKVDKQLPAELREDS